MEPVEIGDCKPSSYPDAAAAFVESAHLAAEVMRSPLVHASWDRPSTLPRMTIGGIAGHVFLVVRRVGQHLEEPEPAVAPRAATYTWLRVDDAADLDRSEHVTVRDDGARVAGWGWSDVVVAYDERVDRVSEQLVASPRRAVRIGDQVMAFDTYLATRVVELLVHTDDLASSVGVAPPEPPHEAASIALHSLLEAARALHGDVAMLRAFTRRERTQASETFVI